MPAALRIAAAAAALLAACSPRFDWRELRQPAAGYVVALPDKPQTTVREVTIEHPAGPLRVEITMLSTGVGASLFAVGSARLPAAAADTPAALAATLSWFRAGLLRNVQAPAASPEALRAPPGLDGRNLQAAEAFSVAGQVGGGRPARLAVRLYVVDDRLFQLVALAADGEVPPLALETFFDSFRLLP